MPQHVTRALIVAGALFLAAGADHAVAQPYGGDAGQQDMLQQLERVQRDLTALQRYVYSSPGGTGTPVGGGGIDAAYRERVEVRLGQLENEMRDMTGQIERLTHSVSQVEQRLEKLVADVDFRLRALEDGQSAGSGSAPGSSSASSADNPDRGASVEPATDNASPGTARAAAATLPSGTPIEAYSRAQQYLSQARYEDAEAAFRQFLQAHGNNQLAENARYWLGETYYVRKRYDDAAATFLEGYQIHPNGGKAADNLLKLSLSLVGLQKNREACVALDKLSAEYPNAPEHISRRAAQERTQIGCG